MSLFLESHREDLSITAQGATLAARGKDSRRRRPELGLAAQETKAAIRLKHKEEPDESQG